MKPILYVGDSHLPRVEKACASSHPETGVFLSAPGPISDLVGFSNGKVIIEEDRAKLKQHPRAAEFDFQSWLDRSLQQYRKIKADSGVELSGYAAIVLLGFRNSFDRSCWEAALSYMRGEISEQVWQRASASLFVRPVRGNVPTHLKLLRQLKKNEDVPPIFVVPAPLKSVAANATDGLLREGEAPADALRLIEARLAEIFESRFGATLVSFPEGLLDAQVIGTALKFQQRNGDVSHINLEGSAIWFKSVFAQITAELQNPRGTAASRRRLTETA